MARPKLDDAAIADALRTLPRWKRVGERIERDFKATSVRHAVALIERIADLAEGAQHHPDLTWSYVNLHISLTTHDSGGLTTNDVHLARVIEDVLADG
ncbi:MAG: 4a-hydroxytetrahydrobiopterin dehydratase [Sandaracinaceae bacterium]|jgi:4a-hydroxytetrahydrobiopterin dehydratase|nr:4a-hydroxytetrahydrobiopterin dehydratase [Sandaracinaceae bacterium]